MDTSERAVVKRVPQRRRRSVEEKRRIVEETLQPDSSVARVARAHGVNANQVSAWRRQYRQDLQEFGSSETRGLLTVRVVNTATPKEVGRARSTAAQPTPSDMIQVELPKGHLRVAGHVDAGALRVVLEKLLG